MCYSGKCPWEDAMGDCMYNYRIIDVRDIYDKVKCGMTIDESYQVYLAESKAKIIKQRKDKIILLKLKLLYKSAYI